MGWKAKAIKITCLNRSVAIQQNIDLNCQTKEKPSQTDNGCNVEAF